MGNKSKYLSQIQSRDYKNQASDNLIDKKHYEQNVINNLKYGKSPRDSADPLNFNAGNVKLVATPP